MELEIVSLLHCLRQQILAPRLQLLNGHLLVRVPAYHQLVETHLVLIHVARVGHYFATFLVWRVMNVIGLVR